MEFVIFDSDFNYIKAMTEEKQTIQIRCKNNKKTQNVAIGSSLSEVFRQFNLKMDYGPISAKVNNKVEGLDFQLYHSKDIEFQDMYSASGSRSYARTLFFVLCKAVHDLYPISLVIIDIPVSNGYYVDVEMEQPITPEVVARIRQRMQEIIDAGIPVKHHEVLTEEAYRMFRDKGDKAKAKLLSSVGRLYTT